MKLASPKQKQGEAVERAAEAHLARHGLRTIARNVHCRMGELDLVMRDGATLVFVEVRYRKSDSHGGAAASVDAHKQSRIVAAARFYLARHPQLAEAPCRFDVVAVHGEAPFRYTWLRDAFHTFA